MRTAIVPAQITTVEDKVAGNLSLTQLLLLAAPVFVSSGIYTILPPSLSASPYKIVLMTTIAVVFAILTIRVKGKILLLWAVIIARYNLRPRHYVLDKNDPHLRIIEQSQDSDFEEAHAESKAGADVIVHPALSAADTVFLEEIIANPKAKLHFKTDRKGGLSVRITEIK